MWRSISQSWPQVAVLVLLLPLVHGSMVSAALEPSDRGFEALDPAGQRSNVERQPAPLRKNRNEPRPALDQIRSPAAARVARDPARLWQFVTDPGTPFADRLAAVAQGAETFPPSYLARLVDAIWLLREEERTHRWGMKRNPFASELFLPVPRGEGGIRRERILLRHRYLLPQEPVEYPQGWKEEQMAPWPWQVREALELLFDLARPGYDLVSGRRGAKGKARAEAWLAACMRLPVTTDREAMQFVEASAASSHYKTIPVLARWRRIALDPRFPGAASQVAGKFGDAMRLWDDPRAHGLGQVLIADIVSESPHIDARHQAAYGIRDLRERFSEGKEIRMPEPAMALAVLGYAVRAPGLESDWNRLYCYAFSAAEAMDQRPIEVDRHLDPKSPQVAIRLAQFKEWFNREKVRLVHTGEQQLREIQSVATALRAMGEPLKDP